MFSAIQKMLPKHLLSRIVGWLAASQIGFIKTLFINVICLFYKIDLSEAQRPAKKDYLSFNDFFTRRLKDGSRPVTGAVSSPADGTVAALGQINGDTLIQSKNHTYSLQTLLAANEVDEYHAGCFITIYLAPHNYHRVHLAVAGNLHSAKYVPGNLFSVNQSTAEQLPNLFARNERLVCRFQTNNGPMTTIMVGAMLVAGIQPVWLDNPYKPRVQVSSEIERQFKQGDELGQFQMGSTVILLFSKRLDFVVEEGQAVCYGEPLV